MVVVEKMDIKDLVSLGLKEAYDVYNIEKLEKEELGEIYHKVRFGINLEFDIYDLFSNNYVVKEKKGIVIIGRRKYPMKDFFSEIENRNALIKKALIESIEDDDIVEGR